MAYVDRAEAMEMIEGNLLQIPRRRTNFNIYDKVRETTCNRTILSWTFRNLRKCVLRRFLCPYGHLYHFGGETLPERK